VPITILLGKGFIRSERELEKRQSPDHQPSPPNGSKDVSLGGVKEVKEGGSQKKEQTRQKYGADFRGLNTRSAPSG